MRIFISGAITGHEAEAKEYFAEAEKIIRARYPLAEIFNPTKIPKQPSHEKYMVICRSRLRNWATDIVYIRNDYYYHSVGATEEALIAEEKGLKEFNLTGKTLLCISASKIGD